MKIRWTDPSKAKRTGGAKSVAPKKVPQNLSKQGKPKVEPKPTNSGIKTNKTKAKSPKPKN